MNDNASHRYAVILAGGHGKRLWPLSTVQQPKQFWGLGDTQPMILKTYERVASCVPEDHIFVSTTEAHADGVRRAIPHLHPSQLIVEPRAVGKPAAFLLLAHRIYDLDPNAVVLTSASDSFVSPLSAFRRDCERGFSFAQSNPEWVAIFGNAPARSDTTLGYVHATGIALDTKGVYVADEFYEKPTQESANKYAADPEFFCNSSHYFFSAKTLIDAYHRVEEVWSSSVQSYAQHGDAIDYPARGGPSHELIPFRDAGVPIGVVAVEFDWHDLGTWPSLYRALEGDDATGVVKLGPGIVDRGSQTSLIVNEGPVTVIAAKLEGLAIVVTDSIVLVAPIEQFEADPGLIANIQRDFESRPNAPVEDGTA